MCISRPGPSLDYFLFTCYYSRACRPEVVEDQPKIAHPKLTRNNFRFSVCKVFFLTLLIS